MVKESRIQPKVPGSSLAYLYPSFFIFFLSFFSVFGLFCCFSINIYLNNCAMCNEQKEKILCFQSKDTLYLDKQSEFLSFPTIYSGKTRVDNHLIISKQHSHELTIVFLSFKKGGPSKGI